MRTPKKLTQIRVKGTVRQITVNALEHILSSNLPSFISCDDAEDMIPFAKQLFEQKRKRIHFNSSNQHGLFSTKILIASNYL